MVAKSKQTGMTGVFMVAAELSKKGFIVAITSRNAKGADLLVTDQQCRNAFSVQVKTNSQAKAFWLVGEQARRMKADSHIYVLVNIDDKKGHGYYIVPSAILAGLVDEDNNKNSDWFYVTKEKAKTYINAWSTFGNPTE